MDVPAGIRGTSLSVESLAGAAQDDPTGHGFYEEFHDNMMSLVGILDNSGLLSRHSGLLLKLRF